MQLDTTRFGTIAVDDSAVITFTQPIIGFQELRRFVILPGPSGSMVSWLQSVDSGSLAFLVMDPRQVVPDYRVDPGPNELAELAATTVADLDIYTLVVVPHDRTQVRTNLKAPIIINAKHRLGKQMVLDRTDYPIQYPLAQARQVSEPESAEAGS